MSQPFFDCLEPCLPHQPTDFAQLAIMSFFGAISVSAVVSIFVLEGPRRSFAIVVLSCVLLLGLRAISWNAPHDWFSGTLIVSVLMFALVSIVYFPVQSKWVNLPLVAGGAVSSALFLAAVETTRFSTQSAYGFVDTIERIEQ